MSTYSNSSQFGVLKIFFKLIYILFLLPFPTFNLPQVLLALKFMLSSIFITDVCKYIYIFLNINSLLNLHNVTCMCMLLGYWLTNWLICWEDYFSCSQHSLVICSPLSRVGTLCDYCLPSVSISVDAIL